MMIIKFYPDDTFKLDRVISQTNQTRKVQELFIENLLRMILVLTLELLRTIRRKG